MLTYVKKLRIYISKKKGRKSGGTDERKKKEKERKQEKGLRSDRPRENIQLSLSFWKPYSLLQVEKWGRN